MSYDRMKKEEQRLRAVVREMVREAEDVDAAEDAEYGKDRAGDEITDVRLRDPKTRMARMLKQEMIRRLRTGRARALYARRKVVVEPVFGQIKDARASAASSFAAWRRSAASGR